MTAEFIAKGKDLEPYQQENSKLKQLLSDYFELKHLQEWFLRAVGELKRLGYVELTGGSTNVVSVLESAIESR